MPLELLERVDLSKPYLDNDTLSAAWDRWTVLTDWRTRWDQVRFVSFVSKGVHEMDQDIVFCSDHEGPLFQDDSTDIGGRYETTIVCQDCLDNDYWTCEGCDRYKSTDDMHSIYDGDGSRCDSCIQQSFQYCDNCDMYVEQGDGDHYHDDDDETAGCCEAKHQTFTMKNDGEAPLQNDTRVTITLPNGVIDQQGINRMSELLIENNYRAIVPLLPELGNEWVTRTGNFTKRLSRLVHQKLSIKIIPDVLSSLGNIGRDHSSTNDAYAVEITRNLNLSAAEFGHAGSCWWGGYGSSRCSLKTNGGLGLRTFDANGRVSGRAWVQPVKLKDGVTADKADRYSLEATSDTLNADGFLVYNGYGDMSGYAPARIVGHMSGMTYRKISLELAPQYVNNASGYLVAPEALATALTSQYVYVDVPAHR